MKSARWRRRRLFASNSSKFRIPVVNGADGWPSRPRLCPPIPSAILTRSLNCAFYPICTPPMVLVLSGTVLQPARPETNVGKMVSLGTVAVANFRFCGRERRHHAEHSAKRHLYSFGNVLYSGDQRVGYAATSRRAVYDQYRGQRRLASESSTARTGR